MEICGIQDKLVKFVCNLCSEIPENKFFITVSCQKSFQVKFASSDIGYFTFAPSGSVICSH